MQQRFIQTGKAIDVSDFKELCFRIIEIFTNERSEHKGILLTVDETAVHRLSTAEIKRKLPIRFSYDEVTLALTELVRIRALDEHVIKGKLFYSRR